jgi:hypothetical protein
MSVRTWVGAVALTTLSLARAEPANTVEAAQVAADNPKMLAQVKRVAITQFVAQFLDRQSGMATSSGLRGGASAKAALTLAGPGVTQYQRIADALYDDAVRAVQAAGIEVIPQEQLAAHPEYAKLVDSGKPSPQEDEKFIGYGGWSVSARGLPITFDSDDEESFLTSSKQADNSGGLGAAFGLLGSAQAAGEFRLHADPARYEAEVLAASRATFTSFASALRAKRQNP